MVDKGGNMKTDAERQRDYAAENFAVSVRLAVSYPKVAAAYRAAEAHEACAAELEARKNRGVLAMIERGRRTTG